jgi:hypothetical protein
VFAAILKGDPDAQPKDQTPRITFKLGDLGVARVFSEVDGANTRAQWMLPPEVIDPKEFGQPSHRIDIYHTGLLLLQLGLEKEMRFSKEDIVAGRPGELAKTLPAPYNFALSKALRRHVAARTNSAMEMWRDLNAPVGEGPQPAPPPIAK